MVLSNIRILDDIKSLSLKSLRLIDNSGIYIYNFVACG